LGTQQAPTPCRAAMTSTSLQTTPGTNVLAPGPEREQELLS
jgi:hypothetical protein